MSKKKVVKSESKPESLSNPRIVELRKYAHEMHLQGFHETVNTLLGIIAALERELIIEKMKGLK